MYYILLFMRGFCQVTNRKEGKGKLRRFPIYHIGNTELAMDDFPEWNPARNHLEEVKTASLKAKNIVRQLLSFARKIKLAKRLTKISPIVTESLRNVLDEK